MSESNYRRLRKLGITGRDTPTCFIAACDRIAPPARVEAMTYLLYTGYVETHDNMPKKARNPAYIDILNVLAPDLGLDTHKDFGFDNVNTARQLGQLVKMCFRRDIGVVLDIDAFDPNYDAPGGDYCHAVGLVLVNLEPARFILRSTYLPRGLGGVLTPTDVFAWLQHQDQKKEPYIKRYPFNNANITTFPIYRPPEAS